MIQKIFSVYDKAAQAYLPPFFMPARGQAIRAFSDMVNSSDNQFGKHPEDYQLHELGEFNDDSGLITQKENPEPIGTGLDFLTKKDNS